MESHASSLPAKRSADSEVEMTEIVLPSDGNALGTAFGGKVMQWIDVCAAIVSQRHARRVVVTASMDELHFHAAIKVGEIAVLKGRVNAAFRRSLEVGVQVHSENPLTGEQRHCCSALLTFVALGPDGKPADVPPLLLETQEERELHAAATARREQRLQHRRASLPR